MVMVNLLFDTLKKKWYQSMIKQQIMLKREKT